MRCALRRATAPSCSANWTWSARSKRAKQLIWCCARATPRQIRSCCATQPIFGSSYRQDVWSTRGFSPMPVDIPSRYLSSVPDLRGGGGGLRRWLFPLALAVLAILVLGLFTSSSTVQAGHVGVVTTFGSVEPVVLQPGFHFVMPFAQRIVQIDTRI